MTATGRWDVCLKDSPQPPKYTPQAYPTTRTTRTSCRSGIKSCPFLLSGTKQVANLVSHESSHICQARHVAECKQGPCQLAVSRQITTRVEEHWAQSAKNTMMERTTGTLNTGAPVVFRRQAWQFRRGSPIYKENCRLGCCPNRSTSWKSPSFFTRNIDSRATSSSSRSMS